MTDYHFGVLFRFVPAAMANVMTRIVSGVNRVFARNTPVEFVPDDPDKLPGDGDRGWWYAGDNIIHARAVGAQGLITYRNTSFVIPRGFKHVLVARVVQNVLLFAVDDPQADGGRWLEIYAIDLTGISPSGTVIDPEDRVMRVCVIDPDGGEITEFFWDETFEELNYDQLPLQSYAGFGTQLVPAFSADGSQFLYGFGNSDWLAKVIDLTLTVSVLSAADLAIFRAIPGYPVNLTRLIRVTSFTESGWDGGKTNYGPGNTPFPETNSPGDLGVAPTQQSYASRQNSHAYTVGQTIHIPVGSYEGPYWIANNNGTSADLGANPVSTFFDEGDPERPGVRIPKSSVVDGSVTWTLGGRFEGSPTGEFTYTAPISAENVPVSGYGYGVTLEAYMADFADETHESTGDAEFPFRDRVYTVINAPSEFSDTAYTSIPVGWGSAPFGADDILINPLVTRVVKMKLVETLYDSSDVPQTPTETWFYLTSHRSLMIYRYSVRTNLPSQPNLSPNGTTGTTGKELVGWCLNRTSQLVEEMYYQEITGATTTASSSGLLPCNADYSFWPQPNVAFAGTDFLAALEASQPGVVSGGDYSYASSGDDRIITGFYIGTQLQYEFYDGYQSFDVHGGLSGSAYSGPFYSRINTGGTVTEVEQYSGNKQTLISPLYNYQAQAYGLIGWEESSWFAEGGSALRSIDQTIACAVSGTITYSQTNTLVDSTTSDYNDSNGALRDMYISPLNASGACLFAVYWQYLDSWSGGGTANPYVNQKLFTSAGQGLTEVDFNGTVVVLADLNTAYPGSGADPMYLEIVSE